MRTITKTVYTFDELSDESKEKAINNLIYINVDYVWWDSMLWDAEDIGLKIITFDLDRHRHAEGYFLLSRNEVAQNILNNHGSQCGTYKTAQSFLDEHEAVFADYMNEDSEHFESYESEQKLLEIEDNFLKELLEDYSMMLQHEYEYRMSDEAIIETIEANEYEFYENGELI